MNSEPCTDWKIDIKDPKLCRNCKKPKSDHVISKIHSASMDQTFEEKPHPIVQTKSNFIVDKSSPNKPNLQKKSEDKIETSKPALCNPVSPTKITEKESLRKAFSPPKDSLKKALSPPKFPEKDSPIVKPILKKPLEENKIIKKPVEKPETVVKAKNIITKTKTDPINKVGNLKSPLKKEEKTQVINDKKGKNEENVSSSSNESEEEKKEIKNSKQIDKNPKNLSIVKDQAFKNKLDSLFKTGGNPMRMNDDCSSALLQKKKSIAPPLANGKRASKTFEDIFDIQTKVEVDKEDIKRQLDILMGKKQAGKKILASIPEGKAEKGKEIREEMIKDMNDNFMDRPQIAKKTKATTRTVKTLNFD